MPKLSILLSTIDDRIFKAENILLTAFPDCEYIIVHQISDQTQKHKYDVFYSQFNSPSYVFIQQFAKGTGKSRNCALQHASGDIFFICDDDISFTDNFLPAIIHAENDYPHADIITFMIKNTEGKPYKKYFKKKRWHNLKTTAKVSNVEMIIRKSFYETTHLQFDERFGLGTIFNTGEEFIFLSDAIKKKAKILFIPEYIAKHPQESSGKRYAPELIKAKGAMIARVYGWRYRIINLLFAIRKYPEYRHTVSFMPFIKYIYTGSRSISDYE